MSVDELRRKIADFQANNPVAAKELSPLCNGMVTEEQSCTLSSSSEPQRRRVSRQWSTEFTDPLESGSRRDLRSNSISAYTDSNLDLGDERTLHHRVVSIPCRRPDRRRSLSV